MRVLLFDHGKGEIGVLLRLLALHPGQDFDDRAAAALAGLALPEAEVRMAELTADHLVQVAAPGRGTALRVSCLAPGPTATGFAAAASATDANLFRRPTMTSADVESSPVLMDALENAGHGVPAALTGGFQQALWVLGVIALIALPAIFGLVRRSERPDGTSKSTLRPAEPALAGTN